MRGTMDAISWVDNLQFIPEKLRLWLGGPGPVAAEGSAPGRRRRSIGFRRLPHAQPTGGQHV